VKTKHVTLLFWSLLLLLSSLLSLLLLLLLMLLFTLLHRSIHFIQQVVDTISLSMASVESVKYVAQICSVVW